MSRYLDKIREHGLRWTAAAVAGRLSDFANKQVRRSKALLAWGYPTLTELLFSPSRQRRLLTIYDLSSQPFSIGDILVVQEASLVLRERHSVELVDFAIVYEPMRPTSGDPVFGTITENNALFHLASVIPVAQVNQHLGSLFIFNSHLQLQHFITDNAARYYVWPPALKFATKDYLYYEIYNKLLYNYYAEHGKIPHLSCRPFLVDWATTFYREHVYPLVPVTIQLRKNKLISQVRNLRLEPWLEFFQYCETHYPVKFIVVTAVSEIDPRLRGLPNVILAKDHHTTIEQDLAFINTAAIHMGASSGPASMAIFNDKPYLIVNTNIGPGSYRGMIEEDGFLRLCFASPFQRFSRSPASAELLITEFARMWSSVDVTRWSSIRGSEIELTHETSWLR